MKKAVTAEVKPLSGFAKKKFLEENGCEFKKVVDDDLPVWICIFEGQEIALRRLQIDCVNAAVEALGGE